MSVKFFLGVYRALSWLNCAEQHEDDLDSKFIFLWVSFNAAYAHEMSNRWETSFFEFYLAVTPSKSVTV